MIQEAINLDVVQSTPGAARLSWGLLHLALKTFLPAMPNWSVTFPRAKKRDLCTPSDADLISILSTISNPIIAKAIEFAAYTGLRRAEICGLRWDAIDFDKRVLYVRRIIVQGKDRVWHDIERTKTENSERTVDLLPVAIDLLNSIERTGEHVFPMVTPQAFTSAFAYVKDKLGLTGLRLHDMRRYAVTMNAELGIPQEYTQEQVGHSTAEMTMHYQGVRDAKREEYINIKDEHLRKILRQVQHNVENT
jgi:integrase